MAIQTTGIDQELSRLATTMIERIDQLIDRIVARSWEVPSFASAGPSAIRPGIEAAMPWLIGALFAEHRPPNHDDRVLSQAFAAGRARGGISAESRVGGFNAALGEIWTFARETAGDLDTTDKAMLVAADAILSWTFFLERVSTEAAVAAERQVAAREERLRATLLHELLTGIESGSFEEFVAIGVVPDRNYVPFRARGEGEGLQTFAESIRARASRGEGFAIVGAFGGDLAGVTDVAIEVSAIGTVVGVGPGSHISEIPRSFQSATKAVEAASTLGLKGLWSVESLGARGAVARDGELGDLLTLRYVKPLEALGEFGRTLLDTVRAYLDHGMGIDTTAASLFIHRNTLKHRLKRFKELTGADFAQTEDVVEIWWALRRSETVTSYYLPHSRAP